MPYKDPERKRQWEREHREERNARRRMWFAARSEPIAPKPTPDPIPAKEPTSAWRVVAGIGACVLAVGIALLAAWGGASTSLDSGPG
jgi:ferric-dicitrate binding protein FerR (iron transport regulator)